MRGLLALVFLVLQLTACATAPAAEEPGRVIVAFGDSLTAGLGVPADQTYPARLGARLKREGYDYRVVNAGVSGDTTAGGLRRVDWALRLKPEIVILELGVNDALRGQKLAGVRANLDRMIARFQAAGARVLVAGMRLPPNYGDGYAEDFHRLYAEVARARHAPCRGSTRPTASIRPRRATPSWWTGSGRTWCRCCSARWGDGGCLKRLSRLRYCRRRDLKRRRSPKGGS
jgi:acyl-CoA thioesterase-1